MKKITYSVVIDKPQEFVFDKLMDKTIYPDWAKAWGEGMTYEGEWKEGEYISFFDKTQGGTKAAIEELAVNKYIKMKHVAMVDPENFEVPLSDEMMKKWIGSREEYYFDKEGEETTLFRVEMEVDEAFEDMMKAWPKALGYFKEICESK